MEWNGISNYGLFMIRTNTYGKIAYDCAPHPNLPECVENDY
jgi:hypothetical protein